MPNSANNLSDKFQTENWLAFWKYSIGNLMYLLHLDAIIGKPMMKHWTRKVNKAIKIK